MVVHDQDPDGLRGGHGVTGRGRAEVAGSDVSSGSVSCILAEVVDDGSGLGGGPERRSGPASGGLGMAVMQERAARWGGVVRVRDLPAGGARMQLTLPLLTSLPAAPSGNRTVRP